MPIKFHFITFLVDLWRFFKLPHLFCLLNAWVDTQERECHYYRNQLWTAPELLRMTTRPINGTQKSDVYSFAIILQEIMFRAKPYFLNVDPPQRRRCYCNSVLFDHTLICYRNYDCYTALSYIWFSFLCFEKTGIFRGSTSICIHEAQIYITN